MDETKLFLELDSALYALNRAIFAAEDIGYETTVELLESYRDNVWNVITNLDPARKG